MDQIKILPSEQAEDGFRPDDFQPLPPSALHQDEIVREPTTYVKDVWRNFRKNKIALVSAVVLLILVFFVLFGPMMNAYDYESNNYSKLNMPPNIDNWFGTDGLGRDLWTRVWV